MCSMAAKTILTAEIVEDARKALAEGREPPMPPLSYPDFVKQPEQASKTTAEKPQLEVTEHVPDSSASRGLSPEKSASLPVHLRTCSTQVEPATPPKWMTYKQAEERDRAAGEQEYLDRPQSGSVDAVVVRNVPKKERPTGKRSPAQHYGVSKLMTLSDSLPCSQAVWQ